MAVFAPLIAPYGPTEILLDPAKNEKVLERPCIHLFGCDESEVQHLMGTDSNGRDVFSRIVYGARVSLIAGAASVVFAVVIGTIIGLVAGFFGRRLDNGLMRCMDVLLSFPSLLLAILIVTVLGRGIVNSVLAIGIVSIPIYAAGRARPGAGAEGAGLRHRRSRARRRRRRACCSIVCSRTR